MTKRGIPKKVLEEVLERSGGLCENVEMDVRCNRYDRWRGAAHHQKHRSQGGTDMPDNLLWLCGRCHAIKHGVKEVG